MFAKVYISSFKVDSHWRIIRNSSTVQFDSVNQVLTNGSSHHLRIQHINLLHFAVGFKTETLKLGTSQHRKQINLFPRIPLSLSIPGTFAETSLPNTRIFGRRLSTGTCSFHYKQHAGSADHSSGKYGLVSLDEELKGGLKDGLFGSWCAVCGFAVADRESGLTGVLGRIGKEEEWRRRRCESCRRSIWGG